MSCCQNFVIYVEKRDGFGRTSDVAVLCDCYKLFVKNQFDLLKQEIQSLKERISQMERESIGID